MFLLIVTIVFFLVVAFLRRRQGGIIPRYREFPPYIGAAWAFGVDPVGTLRRARAELGNVFTLNLVVFDATFVLDAEAYKAYFSAKEDTLSFDEGVRTFMRAIFELPDVGNAAVDACHRVLRQGLMGNEVLGKYERTAACVWDSDAAWEGSFGDLHRECHNLVARVNVKNFMDLKDVDPLRVAELLDAMETNGTHPLALMLPQVPIGPVRRCQRARRELGALLRAEMERRNGADEDDVLSLFGRLESPPPPDLVLDTIIALFFGAAHNTANTLFWTLAHIHADKALLARVRAEAAHASTPLLDACIREVGRLYFSVMLPPRVARKDVALAGKTVPAGSYVCVSPIVLHRDPAHYAAPDEFRADRFLDVAADPTLCQFGFGRHRCTGEKYALRVIKAIVIRSLSRTLTFDGGLPPPTFVKANGTARPAHPLPFKATTSMNGFDY